MVGYMAIEKRWAQVNPAAFTSNGTSEGVITLASTSGLYVKQEVIVKATSQTDLLLEVKRILSKTQLKVGPRKQNLNSYTDLSNYTTAASATIEAPEQPRPSIPAIEHERAVYQEEPVVAKRVFPVDELGNPWNEDNPLPVIATIDGPLPLPVVTTASDDDAVPEDLQVFRLTYTTANTEISQALPENTKQLSVWVDGYYALLRISFVENGTFDGGGANYIPVALGNSYDIRNVKLKNKTLYLQTDKDDQVIIIEAWV